MPWMLVLSRGCVDKLSYGSQPVAWSLLGWHVFRATYAQTQGYPGHNDAQRRLQSRIEPNVYDSYTDLDKQNVLDINGRSS